MFTILASAVLGSDENVFGFLQVSIGVLGATIKNLEAWAKWISNITAFQNNGL